MIDTIREMCSVFYIHVYIWQWTVNAKVTYAAIHDATNSRIQLPKHVTRSLKSEDLTNKIYAISCEWGPLLPVIRGRESRVLRVH